MMRRPRVTLFLALVAVMALGGCAELNFLSQTAKNVNQDQPTGGLYKIGNPYQVEGTWYYPAVDYNYSETGIASWYGPNFHGKYTANGELYDMNDVTAAHKTLPLPSIVRVTNLENGRSIKVRVNDRGPFVKGRIIDMSKRSAQLLGFDGKGTARVRVEIVADESRQLAAALGAKTDPNIVSEKPPPSPLASVSSADLPPPPGAKSGPSSSVSAAPTAVPPPTAYNTGPVGGKEQPDLKIVPTKPTGMYIQAGAFAQFDNADRVRIKLQNFGPTRVTQVNLSDRPLFRVRIGPLQNVDDADKILDRVNKAGYPDARIIVD
jgi:rare lipoprotein A